MTSLLDRFLSEARGLLEQASVDLLALEKAPDDTDVLNSLFRCMHTLKGSSGVVEGLDPLTRVVHAGEDLLDLCREGSLPFSANLADPLFDTVDLVGEWLDALGEDGALPTDAGRISATQAQVLRALIGREAPGPGDGAAAGLPFRPVETCDWLGLVDPALRAQAFQALGQTGQALIAIDYVPDRQCFFVGDDPLFTARSTPGLWWRRIDPVVPWDEDLTVFDPFACALRIRALSHAPLDALDRHFAYVINDVRLIPLTMSDLEALDDQPSAPAAPPLDPATAAIADILRAQVEALTLPMPLEQRLLQLPSRREVLVRTLTALGNVDAVEKLKLTVHDARREEDVALILQVTRDMLIDIGAPEPNMPADMQPDMQPVAAFTEPLTRAPVTAAASNRRGTAPRPRMRQIKVDQERIDALMDLAGELVVAKNALPFLARRAELEFGVRELAREIKSQHQALNRIVEELQAAVMQVRMVPVSAVFGAFPRLVRDYARKLNKKIRLVVEGEDTEADKNVIEDLADPLIHLMRNSIDHGIESPAQRRAAGKAEEGIIALLARQEEDRVVIEVTDDGRGLDVPKLKAKAIEKGLITPEAAADMSDMEAFRLIFAPGFSTAETVSDLSGRGVGMDVVKVAVDRASGVITVNSEPGQGTRVRLSLPLAMAISRVMMVTIADQPFGIPMDHVVETVRIRRADIHQIKGREAAILRQRVVPLRRLRDVLHIHTTIDVWADSGVLEEAVLVVNDGSGHIGLIVDDFEENVEVILKPLTGILSRYAQYSGTAVLGDGRVLLVLNMREILQCH